MSLHIDIVSFKFEAIEVNQVLYKDQTSTSCGSDDINKSRGLIEKFYFLLAEIIIFLTRIMLKILQIRG